VAVHKPQRRLGQSIALKSAQKRMQSKMSRVAYATLNLTAMVDMFTLMVIFLLANFSSSGEFLYTAKDISIPKAAQSAELERAPVISVSGKAVFLEGKEVMSTEEALREDVSTLTELTAQLQDLRKVDEMLHPGRPFAGSVILHCDEGIAFKVVRKVMYAAAAAGYVDVNYAVLSKRET
jgi:biopolymer transport protein ExbD